MRGKTAVPIIVVGLLLMLLGIGQRTIWAPAETVTASLAQDVRSAPVTVIEPGARGNGPGSVEVTVEADGPFTLAVGRTSDVEAWVGDAAHLSVTGVGEESLSSEYAEGDEAVPDPSGSDLWISEEPGEGSLTYRWSEPVEGDWSILLAADGEAPAPAQVSVTRPNDQSTPFALPLIIGGALVVVLGIALLFIAPRNRGGRRGEAVEGTRAYARRHAAGSSRGAASVAAPGSILVVTGLVGAGSLLGVAPGMATTSPTPSSTSSASPTGPSTSSASPTGPSTSSASPTGPSTSSASPTGPSTAPAATASPTAVATGAPSAGSGASGPPVVLDSQLQRILGAVASTVAEADAASDAEQLEPRVDAAALDLRTAAYAVRAKDKQAPAPAPVAADPVLLDMVPTDTEWPRTIVALTQGEDNPVPQALLLVQESPRDNYRLTSAVQMLPGSTFPSPAAPGASGPVPLDEAASLATAPQDAVASIADFLTKPDGSNAQTFEENSFAEAITDFQSGVVADPGNRAATISFTHKAQDDQTHALLTGDGGAMVFGYLTHTYSSVPKAPRDTIDLAGTVYQSLTGEDTSEDGIDVNYGEAVMMYVPPAGSSDRIRVIGAAQQLLSATLR